MAWYDSIIDKCSLVTNYVSSGGQWVLDKLAKPVASYVFNVSLDEPETLQVVKGAAYVGALDISPMLAVNYASHMVQDVLYANGYYYIPQTLNMMASAYYYKKAADALMHTGILFFAGSKAFRASKDNPNTQLICSKDKCKEQPLSTGYLQSNVICVGNEVLVNWSKNWVNPYVGELISTLCWGRFIAESVTPEMCTKHQFKQEYILALGATYKAMDYAMLYALSRLTGAPPQLVYLSLQQLLLLANIKLASHRRVSLTTREEATFSIDLIYAYQLLIASAVDGTIALIPFLTTLYNRVAPWLGINPNAPPMFTLSDVLRFSTNRLNGDLERENQLVVSSPSMAMKVARFLILPIGFQSARMIINDRVIGLYWTDLRKEAVDSLELVLKAKNNKLVKALAWAPKPTAVTVELLIGVPGNITKILLKLTKKEDVWNFVQALHDWFKRHDLNKEVTMIATDSLLQLRQDTKKIELPKLDAAEFVVAKPLELDVPKKEIQIVELPKELKANVPKKVEYDVTDANLLFSKPRSKIVKKPEEQPVVSNSQPEAQIKFAENYF